MQAPITPRTVLFPAPAPGRRPTETMINLCLMNNEAQKSLKLLNPQEQLRF
jgi:hypothetical protein